MVNSIKLEEKVDSGHIQFNFKCLKCGLHFLVCSEFLDWLEKVKMPCCPECGERCTSFLKKEISQNFIFQVISG